MPCVNTVLDIYRSLAQGSFRLLSLVSTSFTLTWQSPERAQVYRSFQVPHVPSGSYVVLQATEKMISHCAEERERDRFNPTAQRRLSSHTSEVILTTEDKEDLVLMQRPATSEEETSSGAGYPSSSDPSSFVSTDRTAALTSEGREFTHPTLLRNRDFDWLSTVQNVRSFLMCCALHDATFCYSL